MATIVVLLDDETARLGTHSGQPACAPPPGDAALWEARALAKRTVYAPKGKPGRGNDRDIRAWLLDHKRRNPCRDCGEPDPAVLDFHHRDPSLKSFSLSSYRGKELWQVRNEADKCDILCANCHRKRHNKERKRPSF